MPAAPAPAPPRAPEVREDAHLSSLAHLFWPGSAAPCPDPVAQDPPGRAGLAACRALPSLLSYQCRESRLDSWSPACCVPFICLALWPSHRPREHEGQCPGSRPRPLCPHSLPQAPCGLRAPRPQLWLAGRFPPWKKPCSELWGGGCVCASGSAPPVIASVTLSPPSRVQGQAPIWLAGVC